MVKKIQTVEEWKIILNKLKKSGKSIGFVPTMGALHKGHKSLVLKSVEENDITIVSIFINPTQFNDPNDLNNYPISLSKDIEMLNDSKADYLFLPDKEIIYPNNYTYKVIETDFSKQLCGEHRPGHFDGVLSVVMKLLNIIEATNSYFGEKDWQQYQLIEGMANAFFLNTKIISCPVIREEDGLAFSSRNRLLTKKDRLIAPEFYKALSSNRSEEDIIKILTKKGFKVDYIKIIKNRILGAVSLGKVRLIDNVKR